MQFEYGRGHCSESMPLGGDSMIHTKVSLFGNFGTVNIGNECTLQAALHNISKFIPGAEINCICSNPKDVLVRHKIEAIQMTRRSHGLSGYSTEGGNRKLLIRVLGVLLVRFPAEMLEWIRALRVLKGRSILLVAGTGVLTDRAEGPLGLPYEIFKWVMIARILHLRVLFVSVGAEPISHKLTKWFIESSLAMADHISYRDNHSKQYMAKLGIKQTSSVYPDLAFSLPESALPTHRKAASTALVIGVGLFDYCRADPDRHSTGETRYTEYLKKLSAFVAWLLDNKYQVRILIGDVTYDSAVRKDVQKVLGGMGISYADCNILDEPICSVSDLLQQIVTTDMVVATRFHNVLLSLMLNKPVISISYDSKNDSLMDSVGLSDYCQRIDELDLAWLTKQFAKLAENKDRLKLQIEERVKEHRKISLQQYADVFSNS